MPPKQSNLKLPAKLIEELGGQGKVSHIFTFSIPANVAKDALSGGSKRRFHTATRKENRKAERAQKKALRNGPPPQKRLKSQHTQGPDAPYDRPPALPQPPPRTKPLQDDAENIPPKPKSILKRTNKEDPVPPKARSTSPPVKISKSVKDKLAEDDAEIAALERKLGLKGKKRLPQSFKDDGLDALLEGLDEDSDSDAHQKKKRKAEGDEWLERKRQEARRAKGLDVSTDEESQSQTDDGEFDDEDSEEDDQHDDDDGASDMSLDGPEFPDDISEDDLSDQADEETLDTEDDFDGFESDEDGSENEASPETQPRVRENPYVAPTAGSDAPSTKYIPPSLRKLSSSDSDILVRLRRQTQGLINRLTEANLISILGEVEKLYRENARQHVTSTLVDVLLTSVCEPTTLPDTLIILPAGFIAAVYKIIGTDFGAQVIQRIVELFNEHYQRATDASQEGSAAPTSDISKETSNLIMLLSELYNFQVVGSNLVFDYIRLLLGKLSELNAELLLKIIRTSGPQLRQDDPTSLKDIVALLRPGTAAVGGEMSVRTKFMIETINDLKNNRMKTGSAASAVTSEHTIRMKKILGTLNTRNIKGSEPLRIGLKDIQDSDKKGKWWLVGASWSGPTEEEIHDSAAAVSGTAKRPRVEDSGTSDLAQLAREQRMNTEVRRAIFIAIMSASDYQDAYMRISKLRLKKKQEFEIPKVLIHCAGAEKSYNPYYTLIAKRLCGDTRLRKSFQFSLWDLFKRMGESDDSDDVPGEDDQDSLDTRQIVNLAKMFGTLIVEGGLSLAVLKKLNLTYLQPGTKTFIEVLFITFFLQSQKQAGANKDEQAVANVMMKVKGSPHLITGLQYFLRKVVNKTDIAGGKEQKATVKWACKVAINALEELAVIDTVNN
jgi:nucleolar MIF4G domain-containing protein 1